MKKNNYFYGKNILVTGGTGMIGRPLVKILLKKKLRSQWFLLIKIIHKVTL